MKTILDLVRISTDFLKENGISDARREAESLIAHAFNMKRMDVYLHFDRPVNVEEARKCSELVLKRVKGTPFEYITGEVRFLGVKIAVTPSVLIPRPETELLAENIVSYLRDKDLQNRSLWDLCCGSGCLGIALKKRFPELDVILSDVSGEALRVAAENARKNRVSVSLKEGNLLEPFQGMKVDYVVCNPPYVTEQEYEELAPEVKKEPKRALVSGKTGLEFYEKLAKGLPVHLNPAGRVWLEIGTGQGEDVRALFKERGWNFCEVERDLAGHDRFVVACLEQ